MKNVKMGLIALASLVGIGGAFAFNHKAPKSLDNVTYYSVYNGASNLYNWTTVQPSSKQCRANITTAFCTIVVTSGTTPVANQVPSSLVSSTTIGSFN